MTFDALRSHGTTPSEQLLHQLCSGTFLTLWSYSNLYRDQGQRGAATDGKELCDLLVVCGDDVLIFSDKSCVYPNGPSPDVAWARWYKRALEKSVTQVFGAERWLRMHPSRVYLDKSCTVRLPLELSGKPRFHRIVVATGARDACRQAHGEPGSIAIRPDVVGAQHTASGAVPFVIGFPDEAKRVVHVLDDITAPALLRQLDTIQDFIAYLREKEALLLRGGLAYSPNELCLLATYLASVGPGERHMLPGGTEASPLTIDPGMWDGLNSLPNVQRKRVADQDSYLWDSLIEHFSGLLRQGQLVGEDANNVAQTELLLRRMALTRRVERRHLAKAILDVRKRVHESGKNSAVRTIAPGNESTSTAFVVIALRNNETDYEKYRRFRLKFLEAYAHITKSRFPDLTHIVGFACEPEGSDGGSEDAILFEPSTWTNEDYARVRAMARAIGLKENPDRRRMRDWEFPSRIAKSPDELRKDRNKKKRERRSRHGK
jgi:hypothetical protein